MKKYLAVVFVFVFMLGAYKANAAVFVTTTLPADSITQTGATLNGVITYTGTTTAGELPITTGFNMIGVGSLPATPSAITSSGSTYSYIFTGGVCDHDYTYYAGAFNQRDNISSSATSTTFHTVACGTTINTANVGTDKAGDIKQNSAMLYGHLNDMGGATSVTYGFVYGTDKETSFGTGMYPHITTPSFSNPMSKAGIFNAAIGSLNCGITYYYKATAKNSAGISYGDMSTFKTNACSSATGTSSLATRSSLSLSTTASAVTTKISPDVMKALVVLGYLDSSDSSVSGKNVIKSAIKSFQIDNSLTVTGKLDKTTSDLIIKMSKAASISTTSSSLGGFALGAVEDNQTTSSDTQPSSKYVFSNNLSYGSTGQDVSELQKILNAKGYLNVSELGDFYGIATTNAVKKFQADNNIQQTGVVGPMTLNVLNQ